MFSSTANVQVSKPNHVFDRDREWDALARFAIIDEFPYLMKASPELPSLIQRALGPRGCAQQSQARLVLSGSAMSVMGRLLGGNAPLRGRASMK